MKDWRITICINTNIYGLSNYGYDCSQYEFFTKPERIEISISSAFSRQCVYRNIKVFDRNQDSTKLYEFRRDSNYHFTDHGVNIKSKNNNKS